MIKSFVYIVYNVLHYFFIRKITRSKHYYTKRLNTFVEIYFVQKGGCPANTPPPPPMTAPAIPETATGQSLLGRSPTTSFT